MYLFYCKLKFYPLATVCSIFNLRSHCYYNSQPDFSDFSDFALFSDLAEEAAEPGEPPDDPWLSDEPGSNKHY